MDSINHHVNNPFYAFPRDILLAVFQYVPDQDLALKVLRVCKQFLRIGSEEILWKERSIRQLGPVLGDSFFKTFNDWKCVYVNFKQMSREGTVISPTEILASNEERRIGKFLNGKLNGLGKIDHKKMIWEGNFKDNELHGQGTITHPNGETWEGEFIRGCLIQGTITYPNRTIKKGFFKNGKLDGRGTITYSNGEIQDGEFRHDKLHGQGTIIFPQPYQKIHEGNFNQGKLDGQGKITCLINGIIAAGHFTDGKLNGQGKVIVPNKKTMEGIFKSGRLHGKGTIIHDDGKIEEGEFRRGKLHGQGSMSFPNGEIWTGKFINSRLNMNSPLIKRVSKN